jgi:hypothetical protein
LLWELFFFSLTIVHLRSLVVCWPDHVLLCLNSHVLIYFFHETYTLFLAWQFKFIELLMLSYTEWHHFD